MERINTLKKEISKKVIGQTDMVEKILIGILTGNHILLEGLPGLAKSLTVSTIAETLGLSFSRIQFTPDLLPSDIVGTEIYNEKTGDFSVKKGPIFANIVLADEINRAPAKVQSALLEAMQEKQVTIASETFKLDKPFIVLATQNPIEQDGTYPLPEAQQDRFLMKVKIEYPTYEEEMEMLDLLTGEKEFSDIRINTIISLQDLEEIKEIIKKVVIDRKLKKYILDIVFKTREHSDYIACGASPRASISLVIASKAAAFLDGRDFVMPQDIRKVIYDVLRHRLILTYESEAEDKKVVDIIDDILKTVVLP